MNKKGKNFEANHPTLGTSQPAPSNHTDEIKGMISKGQIKAALSKAKQYHKTVGTKESEMILVDVYGVRIREMVTKGYTVEAKTLLELIRRRYTCSDQLITELRTVISVSEGKLHDLVEPLTDPSLSQDKRTGLEEIIKNEVVDLNALARCEVLPSDHPLKTGASAAAAAFAKVTTRVVNDEEIALRAISRKSPLAPWKFLIKALACFYRYEDDRCETYLQAVDADSAPARLVPLIRAMIADKLNGNSVGRSGHLVETVIGDRKKIRNAFQMLDSALTAKKPHKVYREARNAVNLCEGSCPELVDRLKQHISIRSWMNDFDAEELTRGLGGSSLKNAYFWRLHARAAEIKGKYLWACALWEEFRKHAVQEGWFSEKGREVAVLYLHMADVLQMLEAEDLEWQRRDFKRSFRGFDSCYHDQPRFVPEAVYKDKRGASDTYFLYPERLYRWASEIDPTSETFRLWLEWVKNDDSDWKQTDAVATAWHAAVPDDTRPLLFLMKSAEKRNALKKAIGYLEKAECLDGLNPDVKRARLRLFVANALRHLKQKKTHLALNDFTEIEALPQSREGDRPAFVVALKSVCAMIDREESKAGKLNEELIKRLENKLTAKLVINGVLTACGLSDRMTNFQSHEKERLEDDDLVAAVARGCKLGDDMGVPVGIPREYGQEINAFFATKECTLDTTTIGIIAEAALRDKNLKLAYAAAGAGLLRGGAAAARFLLLRARSLPTWEMTRRDDCINAAIELARRERDMNLLNEAIELLRDGKGWPFGFSIFDNILDRVGFSMETKELNDVLQREKEARQYPSSMPMDFLNGFGYDSHSEVENKECKCCDQRNCPNRKAPYEPDFLDEDYDFDDDDDCLDDIVDDSLPDLPPGLMSLLMEEFSKHGSKNGSLPNLEELVQRNPKLAEQMLEILLDAEADWNPPNTGPDRFLDFNRKSRQTRRRR